MKKHIRQNGNIIIIILPIILSIFGMVMIYSASKYSAKLDYNDEFFFLKKQGVGLIIGLIGLFVFSKIDYHILKKIRIPILIMSIIFLALVFVPFLSFENYGAKRWIKIFGFTFQPSEIAKFGYVIYVAGYISKYQDKMKTFKGILPIIISGMIICVLIMLEPNMSITMCVLAVMFALLLVGNAKIKHLLIIIIPALILVPILIIIEPYRMKRLLAFINPWLSPKGEGYQLIQSLYALGSGGLFGVGLFNSRQKYKFLPFSESDFILSVIGEEFGFVGMIILFLIYGYIIYKGIVIASKAEDIFGSVLAVGITSIIASQTLINILVVTGSIPPTGLPLPFISSGNNSLIVFLSSIGILFNISKKRKIRD